MVEGPGHTPDGHGGYSPQMILTLDAKPKRISRDAIASAQPGRLQENGMVKAKFSIHAFLKHNCCLYEASNKCLCLNGTGIHSRDLLHL